MPITVGESRRQIVERELSQSRYDWAQNASIIGAQDKDEDVRNEKRMADRYRAWEAANLVTYTPSKYQSAFRRYEGMPLVAFETINPINDKIEVPDPYYD